MIGLWSTLRYSNITMENPPFVKWVSYWKRGNFHCYYVRLLECNTFWVCVATKFWGDLGFHHSGQHTHTETHRHTHTNKDTNKSRYPWPFLLHFATSVSVFPGVFWYHPVKSLKLIQRSRGNCRLFFPLSLLRIGALFLESSSNDYHPHYSHYPMISEPQLALHLKKRLEPHTWLQTIFQLRTQKSGR